MKRWNVLRLTATAVAFADWTWRAQSATTSSHQRLIQSYSLGLKGNELRNSATFRRGHSAKERIKKAEAAEKKLADWIISVQVLENGARFYKLKPGPALGCEFMETWRNRL